MSDEINDAEEWAQSAGSSSQDDDNEYGITPKGSSGDKPTSSKSSNPGQPVQYALYGAGFTSTTATVPTLPPDCYDIKADSKCTYVTAALPPSGILLELPEMRSDDVIKLVDTFWNSESDYKDGNDYVVGGAAFKAGLMIFGPPGSGKSCTIKLVSRKLVEKGGTVFYASGPPSYLETFLGDFAKIEPDRKSIVILEDFDSLIHRYGEAEYLSLLDSAKTINNVLFIATTNYPERLDARIYNRPGRFSHVIKIGLPGAKTREAYLKAILKKHSDVEEIVAGTQGFTIDHLTALVNAVYREGKELNKEIERLKTLFNVPKATGKALGINTKLEETD